MTTKFKEAIALLSDLETELAPDSQLLADLRAEVAQLKLERRELREKVHQLERLESSVKQVLSDPEAFTPDRYRNHDLATKVKIEILRERRDFRDKEWKLMLDRRQLNRDMQDLDRTKTFLSSFLADLSQFRNKVAGPILFPDTYKHEEPSYAEILEQVDQRIADSIEKEAKALAELRVCQAESARLAEQERAESDAADQA